MRPLLLVLVSAAIPWTAAAACSYRLSSPVLTVDLPAHPFSMAVTPDDCWIFVSMPQGDTGKAGIAVVSRKNGRVELIRTVPTPHALGSALTHDGKLLIAAADDHVVFLDVARLTSGKGDPVLGSFSTGDRRQSINANVTEDDKLLFVAEESGAEITVIDLPRARSNGFKADAIMGKIPTGRAPIALVFSPDQHYLFTTSQLAMPDWKWPAACKPEGRQNLTDITNPEGGILVIDVARARTDPAHAVRNRVPAGCSPVRLAISPAGDRIYATARNSNAVVAFDEAKLISDPEHARLGMATVGTAPVPLAVLEGGKRVIAGNSNRFGGSSASETLTLLNAEKIAGSDAVIGSVSVGAFPRDLRVSADGRVLYLVNFGSNTLQVMDIARLEVK